MGGGRRLRVGKVGFVVTVVVLWTSGFIVGLDYGHGWCLMGVQFWTRGIGLELNEALGVLMSFGAWDRFRRIVMEWSRVAGKYGVSHCFLWISFSSTIGVLYLYM